MNEDKILIIDKNKGNKDITSKVYKYILHGNYYSLYYNSNKGKSYNYNLNKIRIIENPKIINGNFNIKTKLCNLSDFDKILKFDNFYKVFFKNKTNKLYNENEISVEQSLFNDVKNKNIFDYLKELSTHLKIGNVTKTEFSKYKTDDFMKRLYDKILFVSEKSILKIFLTANIDENKSKKITDFLYPFNFNLSQKDAIYNAFNNRISVIEGPPGTGKTQTILNILVNAIIQNKTVAVLSNNNSATNNVFEKLEKEGLSNIAAKLGSKDNIDAFLKDNNPDFLYPDNWKLTEDEEGIIKDKIIKMKGEIEKYLKQKNYIANIEQELNKLKLEQNYFIRHLNSNNQGLFKKSFISHFSSEKLYRYLEYLNKQDNETEYFSKKIQVLSQIKFLFINFKLYKNDIESILKNIENYYYNNRIKELEKKLKNERKSIISLNLENKFKEYTEMSMKIFKSYVHNNFSNIKQFSNIELKKTEDFTKSYPIILSTTYSLLNCVENTYLFDYIIVDESSQVDLVSSFPSLALAKNVIVVGDSKQLPNIIDDNNKKKFDEIFNKYDIDSRYNYTKNSLLDLTKNLYSNMPCVMLREHYRCHPKIIGFCNQSFYNNQLIILSQSKDMNPIKHYKCVKGNHARRINDSQFNDRELQIIKNEIIPKENINIDSDSIGIITPYKEQKIYLKNNLNCNNITIDTVHGFQGREKDIIIFSTVANDITKFLDNPNSINVAVSRAKNKLYLITPYEYKSLKNSNMFNLINYIAYHNFEIIESKINSIFDLLYKTNEEKNNFYKNNRKISKYLSEDLMAQQITELLLTEEYSAYQFKRNYPLRLVVRDRSNLTGEENLFIKRNSHLDFAIFNKFNKSIVLAIEVDGYSFHSNEEQIVRDNKKDNILNKSDIHFLRLRTNECNEKQKIIDKLDSIIKSSIDQ